MARVTSKLQVTIPKAVADRYGIKPGAEIAFEPLATRSASCPSTGPSPYRESA